MCRDCWDYDNEDDNEWETPDGEVFYDFPSYSAHLAKIEKAVKSIKKTPRSVAVPPKTRWGKYLRSGDYRPRNIAKAISDFYLLETLVGVEGFEPAKPVLARLVSDLAAEFKEYFLEIVGGELRHASAFLRAGRADEVPEELRYWLSRLTARKDTNRSLAWAQWHAIVDEYGAKALDWAAQTFYEADWENANLEGYGGESWADIANVVGQYLRGGMSDLVFVDRCFALEHNGGCAFDKSYPNGYIRYDRPSFKRKGNSFSDRSFTYATLCLDAHGRDEYEVLLDAASPEVQELWDYNKIRLLTPRREITATSSWGGGAVANFSLFNIDERSPEFLYALEAGGRTGALDSLCYNEQEVLSWAKSVAEVGLEQGPYGNPANPVK